MKVLNRIQKSFSGYFFAKEIVSWFEVKKFLKPDFAIKSVMRVSNTMQVSISGYFLAEEIVS